MHHSKSANFQWSANIADTSNIAYLITEATCLVQGVSPSVAIQHSLITLIYSSLTSTLSQCPGEAVAAWSTNARVAAV